jgi:hypothetical protein
VTPVGLSTARNREADQTAGRLFFGDFLLAKQKKVTRCRATPDNLRKAKPDNQKRNAQKTSSSKVLFISEHYLQSNTGL